ncbi:MAG: aminoglycoside phosphotransferase [Bacteroidetes bacterium]|nr:MAG: aminoglycoside phosphotransferase [Bacteroidota bacterium]
MTFVLNADQLPDIQAFLSDKKWIAPDEEIQSAAKPGEGNMNYTLRIRTNFRSFILKQSRAYVEKYPQIPAPAHRARIEGTFYTYIQEVVALRAFTPELMAMDTAHNILMLEDLGESSDFTFLYQRGATIDPEDLRALMDFLSLLHTHFDTGGEITNREMRLLNAEHIFEYPFRTDNGLDLDSITPGLAKVALAYQTDAALKARITDLSQVYLSEGKTLLHGDFFPGSWLRTYEGVRIIDPEFCFFGPAEFDLAVLLAHLRMSQQEERLSDMVLATYRGAVLDTNLLDQLTGIEIMRRLIGLAQLPLTLTLKEKEDLLAMAYGLINS